MMTVRLFKSPLNSQWYFHIRSGSILTEQIVAQSEGYHNKQDALQTINSIRKGAASASIYDESTGSFVN